MQQALIIPQNNICQLEIAELFISRALLGQLHGAGLLYFWQTLTNPVSFISKIRKQNETGQMTVLKNDFVSAPCVASLPFLPSLLSLPQKSQILVVLGYTSAQKTVGHFDR